MARICEICGRKEDHSSQDHTYDILDVCSDCTNDRNPPNDMNVND